MQSEEGGDVDTVYEHLTLEVEVGLLVRDVRSLCFSMDMRAETSQLVCAIFLLFKARVSITLSPDPVPNHLTNGASI